MINNAELVSKKSRLIAEAQQMVNEGKMQSEEYRLKVDTIDTIQSLIDATVRAGLDKEPVAEPAPIAAPAVITQRDSVEHHICKQRGTAAYGLQ